MRLFLLVLVGVGCAAAARQVRQANTRTSSSQCDFANPSDRIDCGYPGINNVRCEARGCCFDSYSGGHYNCFYGNVHDEKKGVHLEWDDENGCYCKGDETTKGGRGSRDFTVNCQKPEVNNRTPRCVYNGNPHGCGDYNNGGQSKYYWGLLKAIGEKMCLQDGNDMNCLDQTFSNDKMCSKVEFTFKERRTFG